MNSNSNKPDTQPEQPAGDSGSELGKDRKGVEKFSIDFADAEGHDSLWDAGNSRPPMRGRNLRRLGVAVLVIVVVGFAVVGFFDIFGGPITLTVDTLTPTVFFDVIVPLELVTATPTATVFFDVIVPLEIVTSTPTLTATQTTTPTPTATVVEQPTTKKPRCTPDRRHPCP